MPLPQSKTTSISERTLDIAQCLEFEGVVWIDVRTPKEYGKGHIPNAINVPIFTNLEHSEVGKTYKKDGRAQIFDEEEREDIVRKKILDMIKRHQQKNKL